MAHGSSKAAALLFTALALLQACSGGSSPPPPPPAAAPPAIASLTPQVGPVVGGTSVTILGTGFVSGATVTFGGTPAAAVSVTGSTIVVAVTPAHAAGGVDVVVTNPDGQSDGVAGGFGYQAPPPPPAPSITSISPPSGAVDGGTAVTVLGADFVAGATVRFGADAASVTNVQPGAITATTPAHAAGAVDVVVTNPDLQAATLAGGFTYEAAPPPPGPDPVVAAVDPTAGSTLGGTAVTVTGANFVDGAAVLFGGVAATVTGGTATSRSVTTPPHAAGAVAVTVVNPDGGTGTLAGAFTYQVPPPPAPTLAGISPQVGSTAGGTAVTLTGTGFAAGATVTFGGAAGVVTNLSATSISATTPARAAGAVDVTVTNQDGGTATLASAFTFQAPVGTPPSIAAVAPSSGPPGGGTIVVITGAGFLTGAVVAFGGTLAPLAPGTVVTAGSISVTAPAHAVGVVDVTVSNPGGLSSTRAGGYTYLGDPPVLQAINVRGGPTAGGTQVLGTGSGFVAGIAVTVGGAPATSVNLLAVGAGRVAVRFFTPPQPEGRYDVVVTNPDGQSSTLVNGFHYGPPPVISELLCASGCGTVRTGDLLTFNGANFATAPGEGFSVQFTSTDTGQSASGVPQSATPSQIVVPAPTLDGGGRQYFISISNFDGQTAVPPNNPVTYQ